MEKREKNQADVWMEENTVDGNYTEKWLENHALNGHYDDDGNHYYGRGRIDFDDGSAVILDGDYAYFGREERWGKCRCCCDETGDLMDEQCYWCEKREREEDNE